MKNLNTILLATSLIALAAGCASQRTCESEENCCSSKSCCCNKDTSCKDSAACKGDCKDEKKAAAPAAQSAAPINKICPLGGHDADGTITVAYQGKTIAFCCDDCKQEFQGKDDKGKAEILAKAEAK